MIDLTTLQPPTENPHGLSDEEYDAIFTRNKPVVFAFHGSASLIYGLTYRRTNHANLYVRGFIEEGDVTSPFDMRVKNEIDRFHLAELALTRLTSAIKIGAEIKQDIQRKLIANRQCVVKISLKFAIGSGRHIQGLRP